MVGKWSNFIQSLFKQSVVPMLSLSSVILGLLLILSGCQGTGAGVGPEGSLPGAPSFFLPTSPTPSHPDSSLPPLSPFTIPSSSSDSMSSSSTSYQRTYLVDVLLFAGSGTWSAEVSALEGLIQSLGLTYRKMNSSQLNSLSLTDLNQFGLLIFPGGSGGTQAQSLTSQTHAILRSAVQDLGVSYLGFCAGAFIAVAPAPQPGQDVSYGLGIVDGPELDYYELEYQISPDVSMTLESFADGSQRDLLWYGGPVTPQISGGVIARYPNGDPAMTQLYSGRGFVILSGPHPAAPESVKRSFGLSDTDGSDLELTATLIQSALHRVPMKAF